MDYDVEWIERAGRWKYRLRLGDEITMGWAESREDAWALIIGLRTPKRPEFRARVDSNFSPLT